MSWNDPHCRLAWMLGTGGCGSALVHELVARHPDVGFISNVEDRFDCLGWMGRYNGRIFTLVPNRLTGRGRLRYAPSEASRLLARQVSPAVARPFRDLVATDATPWLGGRFQRLFSAKAAAAARPVFLHRFTGWPRAGFLEAVFPESRYVHVVRDGRAVVNSWLQMGWWPGHRGPWEWPWGPLPPYYEAEWKASGRSFAVLAALAWKILLDAFDAARTKIPEGHWLEIRYEDVLDDPRACFAEIVEFLGLPWNRRFERMLARHRFPHQSADIFRCHLDPATLLQVEASLKDHLVAHRYPVSRTRGALHLV